MGILGERLRLLREKNGKTQEDISKVIGTTQQIYSRYETNKTELPVRHLLNCLPTTTSARIICWAGSIIPKSPLNFQIP